MLGPTLSGHADVSGYNLQDHVVVNSLVPGSVSALGTRLPKRAVGNGEVRSKEKH